jgi:GntR family transcriptional regulator
VFLNADSSKPLYIQIAEWLENEILNDHLKADEKVYSQYQLADMFTINPATAAKGLNILADEQILYKKRGLGMFVTANGKEIILQKRKNETLKSLIKEVVIEAKRLKVKEEHLLNLIQQEFKEGIDNEGN